MQKLKLKNMQNIPCSINWKLNREEIFNIANTWKSLKKKETIKNCKLYVKKKEEK